MGSAEVIVSQYWAALEMLRLAIVGCPESLWDDEGYGNRFWHVAYHTLFFTHLYLGDSDESFVAWEKHRKDYQFMGTMPFPPHNEPDIGEPYSKEEILECLDFCRAEVDEKVSLLDLDAESGFFWLPFNKLELQFYSIRHIQHHAGQLIERLKAAEGISIDWVGMKSD